MKRLSLPLTLVLGFVGAVSGPAHADALQGVAKRLVKGLDQLPSKRIAVLPFPYPNGEMSSGSSIISERLTTLLVERGGPEVVERALLDKAMSEIRLGMTGMLDAATTQKLGKVLGVSAIVTGTLNDVDDTTTEVNARLIQTETGKIVTAAMARVRRTWTDLPRKPAPTVSSGETTESNRSSKLIPVASPRRRVPPPVYTGPMRPLDPDSIDDSGQEVLTLTNADLIPLNYHGQTDPEGIVNQFLSDSRPAPANGVRMARRIYHSNLDPRIRGRALLAMGHLLERTGRPEQAATAYSQILKEFPDTPALQAEAHQRLEHVSPER